MQRILDVLFSFLAILFLAPLLIPVCIILRLTGEGEIFYLQDRIGRFGNSFRIYKFATMLKDSPNIGSGTVTVSDDPRVLPFGAWLRKTKINELPQLLNIFFGHMSIIGPRPVTTREFELYDEASKAAVSSVRPGLSGVGSVIFRDEETLMSLGENPRDVYKDYISPYKGELEQWFTANNSIVTYFKLIFLTVWVVLFPKSDIVWRALKGLPVPSSKISEAINYQGISIE